MQTQLAVIGGGPGGYTAAFLAADAGLDVTIVDHEGRLGGACLLRGCIPSKALLHLANVMAEVERIGQSWGVTYNQPQIELPQLRARKDEVIATMSGGLSQLAARRKVQVVNAKARFKDSRTLELSGDDRSIPQDRVIAFDHCIIATGARPARPPSLAIDSARVIDSTGALALHDLPQRLLVIGGGYIGLEMGTVYAQLGAEVSLVEQTSGLLPGADRDLVRPLQRRLNQLMGERIYLDTSVTSLRESEDGVEVRFEGTSKEGTEYYDRVLVAVGRQPNSHDLGLETTDVQLDARGFICCDAGCQTADKAILAIGDVTGEPMLAHKATYQAKLAVATLTGHPARSTELTIPAVVFTDPEIAWAGLTETAARAENRAIEVALYPWAASGRAQAIGAPQGLTKWIVEPESNRVVGCGIVGTGAGELIAEATLAIAMNCSVHDVSETIHPHPTLSETVMNAADLFLGKAVEIYKPRRKRVTG